MFEQATPLRASVSSSVTRCIASTLQRHVPLYEDRSCIRTGFTASCCVPATVLSRDGTGPAGCTSAGMSSLALIAYRSSWIPGGSTSSRTGTAHRAARARSGPNLRGSCTSTSSAFTPTSTAMVGRRESCSTCSDDERAFRGRLLSPRWRTRTIERYAGMRNVSSLRSSDND